MLATTLALPVFPPLHNTGVEVVDATSSVGSVTVALVVIVHPFASVTVTVYAPALSPLAVAAVPPDGDHEYVYPAVPLLATTLALPEFPPLHKTAVAVAEDVSNVGWVTAVTAVDVHPIASVTVTV